ncbi:putative transporter MMPL [Candidatus Gastranaerophilus sp. (ex Termes propinquus)]|nr:putative transporter MMPL [Candidatus Gastranaerophilus sp. (ex Termes propinquus)]
MKRTDFARIFLICILVALALFATFGSKSQVETNILKAVLKDKTLLELASRDSSRVSVIFEGEDIESVKEEFYERLDKKYLKKEPTEGLFEVWQKYPNNFLSSAKIKKLENKEYDTLVDESLQMLYSPMGVALVPLSEDPFMFFTDYVLSLKESSAYGKDNVLTLNLDKNAADSPNIQKNINGEVRKIIQTQKELSSKDTQIHLAGALIHSWTTSSKSILEINIICLLATAMVICLCKFYFNSIKIIAPIATGIGLGILCGYLVTVLVFPSVHILTFVFSTTLIGICLDYFLHFYIEKDLSKIFKTLTISVLTTICAFSVLFLSDIALLKQIAIFTSSGLLAVYFFVILFCPQINTKTKDLKILKPPAAFVLALCIVAALGLFRLKFNDDIRAMYTPPKKLAAAEKLLNSGVPTFALAKAADFESLMQKEEELAILLEGSKYVSLSKFVPSASRQWENQKLIKEFHQEKLGLYAAFLDDKQREKLLAGVQTEILDKSEFPYLNDFLASTEEGAASIVIIKNARELPDIEGVEYIKPSEEISKIMKTSREKCLSLLAPAFAAIFIFLALIYKPKTALQLVLPSLLGVLFAFGILGVLGQGINLFHVLAAFLIIGFSLDYSIFRVSGLKNSKDAVLISCATSAFSFILLSFTSFKLISSLGLTVAAGLLSSYIFSLLLISEKSEQETESANSGKSFSESADLASP